MTGLINIFSAREVLPLVYAGAALTAVLFFAAGRLNRVTAGSVLKDPGLYGVTGRMGSGKSYLLALAAWWAMRARRQVWANYPLRGAHAYENWSEMLAAPDGALVIIDEAHLWWASGDHDAPVSVKSWITQLRKRRITCLWASQDFDFVATWLRKLSFGVWECTNTRGTHRYTLVHPRHAGRDPKYQKSMARFRTRRRKKIEHLYDTTLTVGASREWGGFGAQPAETG